MPVFKRKPYWSWGRLLHFAEALIVTGGLGWWLGDGGLVVGTCLSVCAGGMWEFINRWFPKGNWMYGDVLDFIFFVLGAVFADVGYWILTGGS